MKEEGRTCGGEGRMTHLRSSPVFSRCRTFQFFANKAGMLIVSCSTSWELVLFVLKRERKTEASEKKKK